MIGSRLKTNQNLLNSIEQLTESARTGIQSAITMVGQKEIRMSFNFGRCLGFNFSLLTDMLYITE